MSSRSERKVLSHLDGCPDMDAMVVRVAHVELLINDGESHGVPQIAELAARGAEGATPGESGRVEKHDALIALIGHEEHPMRKRKSLRGAKLVGRRAIAATSELVTAAREAYFGHAAVAAVRHPHVDAVRGEPRRVAGPSSGDDAQRLAIR